MFGLKEVALQVKSLWSHQSEGNPNLGNSIKSSWIKLLKAITTSQNPELNGCRSKRLTNAPVFECVISFALCAVICVAMPKDATGA